MAKYKLTLKKKVYGIYNEDTRKYDVTYADIQFNCDTADQLVGLLEFMVNTSDDALDLTIGRRDDDE